MNHRLFNFYICKSFLIESIGNILQNIGYTMSQINTDCFVSCRNKDQKFGGIQRGRVQPCFCI